MTTNNKDSLSERDICTKRIIPALKSAGWDIQSQIREEVSITNGRIRVRGQRHRRDAPKRADFVLYYKRNIPLRLTCLPETGPEVELDSQWITFVGIAASSTRLQSGTPEWTNLELPGGLLGRK